MKDLYGVRENDLQKLKENGYISGEKTIMKDGCSYDGTQTYAIFFDTSTEKERAYRFLYN